MSKNNTAASENVGTVNVSECLKAVKTAEEQAAQIRRSAVTKSAGVISDAERECAEMIAKAREDADARISAHTADCERRSKAKVSNESAKAERRANALIEKAMRNYEQAVDRVVRGVIG